MLKDLRRKVHSKQVTAGGWITLPELSIAEIFANAGFDWIVVDLEHSIIGIEKMGDLIRVIDLSGVPALVRLTSNDENLIKRALDCGAHGVIVPNISNKKEAEKAVAATKYAPFGNRGVGLGRAQSYGCEFAEYFSWVTNSGPFVVAMIESKEGLGNIKEILNVPGVDAFLIGPYDLSCSLGVPGQFNSKIYQDALNIILKAGLEMGCIPGIHVVEPSPSKLKAAVADGYRFIACGVDIRMLDIMARNSLDAINSEKK